MKIPFGAMIKNINFQRLYFLLHFLTTNFRIILSADKIANETSKKPFEGYFPFFSLLQELTLEKYAKLFLAVACMLEHIHYDFSHKSALD